MPRTITTATQTEIDTELGTEPIVVVQIDWSSGTVYYGDKTITIGALSVVGRIIECDVLSNQVTFESRGDISSVTVTLSDSGGDLKTIWNTEVVESATMTVYHYYIGTAQSDMTELFTGRIINPITWNEGDRTLALEAETNLNSENIGYAPEEGDISGLLDEAVGKTWPLAFGTCIHVPCQHIIGSLRGTLRDGINNLFKEFYINDSDDFPQSSTIQVQINNILFTGTLVDGVFTVISINDAKYTNINILPRQSKDPDISNTKVLWIDSDVSLVDQYVYVSSPQYGPLVNYCTGQSNNKCFFKKPWSKNDDYAGITLDSRAQILETAGLPRGSWPLSYTFEGGLAYDPTTHDPNGGYALTWNVEPDVFSIAAGAKVRLIDGTDEVYVANLLTSYVVLDVFAWRVDKDGKRVFDPVPSRYYTYNLSDSYHTHSPTTFTLERPLDEYEGENWENTLYVSLRSSIGPNACDVIEHLVDTYTNHTVDATTFSSVRPKVSPYWTNFAKFDQPDALSVCADIAWQTRMAITVRNEKIVFHYLSEIPTADLVVSEDEVELKSMILGFSRTEDIVTRIEAKYKLDYSGKDETELTMIYERNNGVYPSNDLDIEMYTYNVWEFVKLTLYWWGYRKSNSWREVVAKHFNYALPSEAFDAIGYSIDTLSTNTIRSEVQHVGVDTAEPTVAVESVLASKASDVDGSDQPVEDTRFWIGDPDFDMNTVLEPIDPGNGRQEIDWIVPRPDEDDNGDFQGEDTDGDEYTGYLRFTQYPNEEQRANSFGLKIEAFNFLDNRIFDDIEATIQFVGSDASDGINVANITMTGGEWITATAQVTGGSGDDTVDLTVAAADYANGDCTFAIVDSKSTLTWTTSPASVSRPNVFTVGISGGTAGLVLDVSLNSTDGYDLLHNAAGEITTITMDGSGNYTATDWYITGGTETDAANMTVVDQGTAFDPATCTQFPITGNTVMNAEDAVTVSQTVSINRIYPILDPPAYIAAGETFELDASMVQQTDGSVDTAFNGVFGIQVVDDSDKSIDWQDAGPDGTALGDTARVTVASGVWEYLSCGLYLPSGVASPAKFTVYDAAAGPDPFNTAYSVPIKTGYFVVTLPDSICRGYNFPMTIQAKYNDGTDWTSYVPTSSGVDITIDSDDPSDVVSPTSTNNTGWSNGAKTITTMQVTGGSGVDDFTITATDAYDSSLFGSGSSEVGTTVPSSCPSGLPTDLVMDYGSGTLTISDFTINSPFPQGTAYPNTSSCLWTAADIEGMSPSNINYQWRNLTIGFSATNYWNLFIYSKHYFGGFDKVLEARKYCGDSPLGTYSVVYRLSTYPIITNTIDSIVISEA